MLKGRRINVLLIEDEAYDVRRIKNTIRLSETDIYIHDVVSNGQSAVELVADSNNQYDVVIMDYQIAGSLSGEDLIQRLKKLDPLLQIIVITKMTLNITDFDFANRLLTAGAMWYCTKYPGDIEDYIYQPTDFILSIYNAYEKRSLEKARRRSDKKLDRNIEEIVFSKRIVGESATIGYLRQQIKNCAETETTVLVRGDSGTGKELVAANIHYNSARRYEKFVPINCGSLPADLIESELFGFEKGAFTGAATQKPGLFEVANKGTIFLDEVAELPLSSQVKLLRVLQEGELDKIGRTQQVKVDVRVIAATNKSLEDAVRDGRFRKDLYYRLNVVFIQLPSLKERKTDIPLLIKHFLEKYSNEMSLPAPEVAEAGMSLLVNHGWPGNVRELQNVVQRLIFAREKEIDAPLVKNSLGMLLDSPTGNIYAWDPDNILPLREIERQFREQYFQFVRQHTQSDAEAARLLGLAPSNYHRMCKELGLK